MKWGICWKTFPTGSTSSSSWRQQQEAVTALPLATKRSNVCWSFRYIKKMQNRSEIPHFAVLSRLSCPGCPVLAVLSWLSCPCCPVLAVLSWLFCHGFSVPVLLSQLSCPCSHVLAVSWSPIQNQPDPKLFTLAKLDPYPKAILDQDQDPKLLWKYPSAPLWVKFVL